MIRMISMTVGFVVTTLGLVWVLGGDDPQAPTDQVSRASPDMISLQPAFVPATAPVSAQPVVPVETAPVVAAPQVPVRQPEPVASAPRDKVGSAVEAMGYGILEELKKPSTAASDVTVTARAVPQPVAPTPVATRSYTVQPGDSLPGIAFRFYGTTVAYLQILDANRDVVRSPAELRPGMVLSIPE